MSARAGEQVFPWSWYTDPDVLRAEQEHVFRRCWQYVARADQLSQPGQFVATRAGDVPVLVVRGRDEELRAFLNVCRHRGSLVCEGEGRRETLQCPYHAWTYDLDGSLRSAPRTDREPGFDADGLGLLQLQVGVAARSSSSTLIGKRRRSATSSARCPSSSRRRGSTSTTCDSSPGGE